MNPSLPQEPAMPIEADPSDMVDMAVQSGVAAPELDTAPPDPEREALVRSWWERTAETADFREAVAQSARDAQTLDAGTPGEVANTESITVNHVYRNAIQTVAMTVPELMSVSWKPRDEVEPPPGMPIPPEIVERRRQQQGLASVLTVLHKRFAEMGDLQEKVEAWVQDSVHFSVSIVKVWFQRDLADDPIGSTRLPDEQDLIAKARVLIEQYDRGEFLKDSAQHLEMVNCLHAARRTEADIQRGIVVELVPLANYRCDPSVTGPECHSSAAWESNDVMMTRDEVLAKWPEVHPDDLESGIVYEIDATGRAIKQEREDRTKTTSREVLNDRSRIVRGEDWLLCREIYDYRTNHRFVLVEGLAYPVVMEPIERAPLGMSPFVILVENRRPGRFYGFSDTQLQEKPQRALNKLRTQEEAARRNAQPRWGYDPAAITDAKVIRSIEEQEPWTMVPIPINGASKSIKDAVFELAGNHAFSPVEYDGTKHIQEMRKMASLPEQSTGELGNAEFATEVQAAMQGANALSRYRQTRIKRAIAKLCSKVAVLLLLNVNKDQAIRFGGPLAQMFWPDTPPDRQTIYEGLSVDVELEMDKQMDFAKRSDTLVKFLEVLGKMGVVFDKEAAGRLLGKFMGVTGADNLLKADPNDLIGRLMQAMQDGTTPLAPEAAMALTQLGQVAAAQVQQQAMQQMQQDPQQPPAPGM